MFSVYGSLPAAWSGPRSTSLAVQGQQFQALPQLGIYCQPGGAPGAQRDPWNLKRILRRFVPGQLRPGAWCSLYGLYQLKHLVTPLHKL